MSDYSDSQELLQDFLTEAGELLEDVDSKLVELEAKPTNKELLNSIFRGFHTIKGGAGFLDATALVNLCHRTENLFDQFRSGTKSLTPELLDVIFAATGEVRRMFDEMSNSRAPHPAPDELLATLDASIAGISSAQAHHPDETPAEKPIVASHSNVNASTTSDNDTMKMDDGLDWSKMYHAIVGDDVEENIDHTTEIADEVVDSVTMKRIHEVKTPPTSEQQNLKVPESKPEGTKSRSTPTPNAANNKDGTIRVDTLRFDQILNLSGEIGLTKNRLNSLRRAVLRNDNDENTRQTLEQVLGQLDTLVGDLQSAVMKARMQPVGRVFQKYSRLARDLARQLGKDVELNISGAETEVDKTILDELNDPLVHLIRNAVDHGLETKQERRNIGKAERGTVELSAHQIGDHIVIEISDDGRGMRPDIIRQKAIEKGLITTEEASLLDQRQCLQLIFLPGFSTKTEITDVSGRGVGMDVVKTNIQKLKGRIDLHSEPGSGSKITISLPLTLAILPVLMLKLNEQTYSLPLSAVREIIQIEDSKIQYVNAKPTIVVRGEVLPLIDLAHVLHKQRDKPSTVGVVATLGEKGYILAVDSLVGQDEVMIKPLEGFKPKGVAGATLSGEGVLVLVLEMYELLEGHL
jgi:two-component system chemotaxis sensor kinase CheA